MTRSVCVLALCSCLVFPIPFAAAQYSAPLTVDPSIVVVRIAGPWQNGGQRGFSRLVAAASAGRLALAVEWIGEDGSIVQTLPLETPPGAENLAFASVKNESSAADSAVYFSVQGETFVLIVGAPGEARFGPASN